MKIRYGSMIVLLTVIMSSGAFAESSDMHICKDIDTMTNLGYMDRCEHRIECARAGDSTIDYYLAAKCGYDHQGFGVMGHELLKWFKIEAEKGHYGSLFHLGKMYEMSIGVNGDLDKALVFYEKALKHYNGTDDRAVQRVHEKRKEMIKNLALQNSCDVRTTEVFGTMLKCTDRESLDQAIRKAGGILSEENESYIKYDSRHLFVDSKNLEVYFTNEGRFSCMKYSFGMFKSNGFIKDMMTILTQKYGYYEEYSSEISARNTATWNLDDGVVITLKKATYNSTLEYCLPAFETIRLAEVDKQAQQSLSRKSVIQSNAY